MTLRRGRHGPRLRRPQTPLAKQPEPDPKRRAIAAPLTILKHPATRRSDQSMWRPAFYAWLIKATITGSIKLYLAVNRATAPE